MWLGGWTGPEAQDAKRAEEAVVWYDLLFTPGRSHMLKLAEQADVSKRDAGAIIAEVQTAVGHWFDLAG